MTCLWTKWYVDLPLTCADWADLWICQNRQRNHGKTHQDVDGSSGIRDIKAHVSRSCGLANSKSADHLVWRLSEGPVVSMLARSQRCVRHT
jgi:hypothetical protein